MLYTSTTRIPLHMNLREDVHESRNMWDSIYFKLMQFKYLSTVSVFCWSCMNNIIFNAWNMNNIRPVVCYKHKTRKVTVSWCSVCKAVSRHSAPSWIKARYCDIFKTRNVCWIFYQRFHRNPSAINKIITILNELLHNSGQIYIPPQ